MISWWRQLAFDAGYDPNYWVLAVGIFLIAFGLFLGVVTWEFIYGFRDVREERYPDNERDFY